MSVLRRATVRLAGFLRKSSREREMADEFESHFSLHIEDSIRSRMTEAEAYRQAVLMFGGIDSVKEELREMSTTLWLEVTLRDLQYGCAACAAIPGSPSPRFCPWLWASAPASRSSQWPTVFCCGHCRLGAGPGSDGGERTPASVPTTM